MFKNLRYKLIWVILALILCAVVSTLLFLQKTYLPAAFFTLLTVICGIALVRIYHYNIRKITFMFNAIESGDYAFRFSDNESAIHDNTFNQTLNRIKGLMLKARQEIREQESYYELILSHVITGIVVLNDKGFVFQTNADDLYPCSSTQPFSRIVTRSFLGIAQRRHAKRYALQRTGDLAPLVTGLGGNDPGRTYEDHLHQRYRSATGR